ncbi:DMT family transporter [Cedecea sp.]|uniref:DMT family transporter n=1 Tax=Cedecea sp. TaxID=1970739 RepID=UPI002F40BA27
MLSSKKSATEAAPHKPSAWYVLLLFTIPPLLWACNYIVGKAVRNDIPPVGLTFMRWLVALIVILPFAFPYIKRDFRRYREYLGWIIAVSVTGIVCFSLLVYIGLHHTSSTNALLLNSCIPVLIMLFGALFFGHKLSVKQVVGLAISCCGVLFIIFKGDIHGLLQMAFSSGDLMLLAAMACFALYTLWIRKIPSDISRMGLLGVQVAIALVVTLPLWLHELSTGAVPHWNTMTISAVIFLGAFPSFVSYLLYGRCVEAVGAARAGLSIHLIPVFGVVLSLVFLGETLHLFHIIGIATILIGVALASRH